MLAEAFMRVHEVKTLEDLKLYKKKKRVKFGRV